MSKQKTFFLVATLTILTSGVIAAHDGNFPVDKLIKDRGLTSEQRKNIRHIGRSARTDGALYKQDVQDLKKEISQLIYSDDFTTADVEYVITQRQAIISRLGLRRAAALHEMWKELTPEQQIELNSVLIDEYDRVAHRREKAERFFKRLDLTSEQTAKINAIKADIKQQREQFKPTKSAFKTAQRKLVLSDNFSADAWQEMRQPYLDATLNMAILTAKARHDMWTVLDDKQQQKLTAILHGHKQRRHHRKSFNRGERPRATPYTVG